MGFDRNTIIGFVLLGLLLFVYLFINTKSSHELEAQRKHIADSIAVVNKVKEDAAEKAAAAAAAAQKDTTTKVVDTTGFNRGFAGKEQLVTLENDLVKVVLSNKGGQPVDVELKQFKTYDSSLVKLIGPGPENRINYPINTGSTGARDITDLYFDAGPVVKNADGSQTVSFKLPSPAGQGAVPLSVPPSV